MRRLRLGQRLLERRSRGGGFRLPHAEFRLAAREELGGRGRVRNALALGPFERFGGLCRLALERQSQVGRLSLRGVVPSLHIGEPRDDPRQFRRVPCVGVAVRRLRGGKLLVERRPPVHFLREQIVEPRQALVRRGEVPVRLLPGVPLRGFRLRQRALERGSRGNRFVQRGAQFRFAPPEVFGRRGRVRPPGVLRLVERGGRRRESGGQRVPRLERAGQAGGELRVPLRDLVGKGARFGRAAILHLPQPVLELEQPLLQRRADPRVAGQRRGVTGPNLGDLRRRSRQLGGATLFGLFARFFGERELLHRPIARRLQPGHRLCQQVPAAAFAVDRLVHDPRQVRGQRRAGHQVAVGARIERLEGWLDPKRSHDHDDGHGQAEPAHLRHERRTALGLHLHDDGGGIAVRLQPLQGGGRRSGPRHRDILCNFVQRPRGDPRGLVFRRDVKNLHGGERPRFSIYRSISPDVQSRAVPSSTVEELSGNSDLSSKAPTCLPDWINSSTSWFS